MKENKTTILTGGGRWSPLLLTFSGAILGPLHIIPTLLLPILSVKIVDSGLYFIFSFYFILLYFTFSFSFLYF